METVKDAQLCMHNRSLAKHLHWFKTKKLQGNRFYKVNLFRLLLQYTQINYKSQVQQWPGATFKRYFTYLVFIEKNVSTCI